MGLVLASVIRVCIAWFTLILDGLEFVGRWIYYFV